MTGSSATAKACGYLQDLPQIVDFDTAMNLPRGEVLIVATGGQGEPRAALGRISEGNHQIALEAGDVVLFSSRQIPGNEVAIGRIQNRLAGQHVTIVTDRQAEIHVSGHPGRPELEALYSWIRPEILVPVHGEVRHMKEQGAARPCLRDPQGGDAAERRSCAGLAPGKPGKLSRSARRPPDPRWRHHLRLPMAKRS